MLGGGVDAATLVAALGAGPPPPECRWGLSTCSRSSTSSLRKWLQSECTLVCCCCERVNLKFSLVVDGTRLLRRSFALA